MSTNTPGQPDPFEFLSRLEIAATYKIPVPTQVCWFNQNRYGWRGMTIKCGRRVVIRRCDLEAWFESRKGLVREPAARRAKPAQAEAAAVAS